MLGEFCVDLFLHGLYAVKAVFPRRRKYPLHISVFVLQGLFVPVKISAEFLDEGYYL